MRAPLEKKLQENPRFFEALRSEIEALAAEAISQARSPFPCANSPPHSPDA